jgi:hypothetical protein
METWPSRNWIWSSSPPARWHSRAQVRRRSCGASLSMPARAAAARTTSHSTFGDMPSHQTRPALLIARKTRPPVIATDAVHASTAVFTQSTWRASRGPATREVSTVSRTREVVGPARVSASCPDELQSVGRPSHDGCPPRVLGSAGQRRRPRTLRRIDDGLLHRRQSFIERSSLRRH